MEEGRMSRDDCLATMNNTQYRKICDGKFIKIKNGRKHNRIVSQFQQSLYSDRCYGP